MRLQIIVILLALIGVVSGLAQLSEEYITITITSEGKAKISQTLFPKTFVSTIDVHIISEKISNLLAIDEKDILLGTTQNQDLLKIATLGASTVDLKYNAGILSYESGVFKLKYNSELESKVILPPLSKLVSLNTIPIEITNRKYALPPGDISLSYTIRPVTSKEFLVTIDDSEQKIETITAAKIEEFSVNSDEIQFIIKEKAIVLTIIPKTVMNNPNDALLNGEEVDFSQFHQNATHSWIRIDPHEKGLVRILDTSKGGGCLIATATYGSEMAPQVQLLREIRDNQLMNTGFGAAFMTSFNQFYYSFSPFLADIERENPIFKEYVKIGITPMIFSLSVMSFAESEHETLGLGIGVILMNIGMYFVLPFLTCYQIMRIIRTRRKAKSNWAVISNCNVLSVLKTSLFGIIALSVLLVSVSSAFESAYAEEGDPIRMVLDLTRENIIESLESTENVPSTAQTFYEMGQEEYQKAIDALDNGDLEAAEEYALIAMALFEDSASVIGELEESLVLDQLPPGFGSAVGSTSDTGISQGQGLGIGGIPPGLLKQLTAANIFDIQEAITDSINEENELQGLIDSNNFDIDSGEYDKSINLAKEALSNGDIPNALTKLALANEIKDNLFDEINVEIENNEDERIQEFVDNSINSIEELLEKENLGLTKKAIGELEDVLEVLKSGEIDDILEKTDDDSELAKELDEIDDAPGNSGDAPGQDKEEGDAPGNSGDAPGQDKEEGDAPGNSGDAPGQDKEEGDAPGNSGDAPAQDKGNENAELPPGFGAAGDNPSENGFANGQGLGLGKIPPGLAKLFGYDDGTGDNEDYEVTEGLPPGFGAAGDNPSENGFANGQGLGKIPPGQLKKFEAGLYSVYSPDDYFDDAIDDLKEDNFEDKFDELYKNSKAKEKKDKEKEEKSKGNTNGGNPNCNNEGITDGDSGNTSGFVGVDYTVQGFTAIGSNCKNETDKIKIRIDGPSSPPSEYNNESQPFTFQPDEVGIWTIEAKAVGQFGTRTVNVVTAPAAYVVDLMDVYLSSSTTLDNGIAVCTEVDLESASSCGANLEQGLTYRFEIEVDNNFSISKAPNQLDFESSVAASDVLGTIVAGDILNSGCSTTTDWAESIVTTTARASSGTTCSISAGGTVEFWMVITLDTDADDGTATFNITDGTDSDTSTTTTFTVLTAGANNAPTVTNPITDQAVGPGGNPDDFVIDLRTVFGDIEDDDDELTYSIESNTFAPGTFTSISIDANDVLTINYRNGNPGNGNGDITIRATDTGGKIVEDIFNVDDS